MLTGPRTDVVRQTGAEAGEGRERVICVTLACGPRERLNATPTLHQDDAGSESSQRIYTMTTLR